MTVRRTLLRRLSLLAVAAVTALTVGMAPAQAATPGGALTCHGGSIPAGAYSSLTVSGFCQLDAGSVTVFGNMTISPGAGLLAAFGGSDLTVGRNLTVGQNAILALGCEPEAFPCFNDPDQAVGTLSTHDAIGGNLTADRALMMLLHNNRVGGNVSQQGGGGGVTCDIQPLGPDGPPAYSTYEDNRIGGNAIVSGVHTCWLGFIRNTVGRNVNYNDNLLADPDGNEVVTNTIGGNLNCSGNDPAPQVGDSQGNPNIVGGRSTGQCHR